MTTSAPERIQTARLVGKRVGTADLADLQALYQDRQVMATLSTDGQPVGDVEILARLHKLVDHWKEHGYGVWHFRADNRFVGRAGLRNVQVSGCGEIELLYALMPAYWGSGLASEAARAALAAGFEATDARSIIAYTLPSNGASRGVMEKLGFVYERDFVRADLPHVLYRLARSHWQSSA